MKKILIFLFSFFLIASSFAPVFHPYHVGSVEFNYNSKTETFEITGKFFVDDLENAINDKYKTKLHFQDEKYKAKMNEALKSYLEHHILLKTENKFVKINYLGYEEKQESVYFYMETENIKPPKKVETAVSVIYNLYDDQMNIIHIIIDGKRQSQKLTYPNRYLYKNF